MNAILTPPMRAPAEAFDPAKGQRFLMHGVTYAMYVAVTDALMDRPGLRATFDGERLEFMTVSSLHELYKEWIGTLVRFLAMEYGVSIIALGQMTFRHPRVQRGAEPDNCYWIANQPAMRGRREWLPDRDPPPDLVVEIEVSRSSLDRMAIWAAIGVPEVWRFDGDVLHIERLHEDGGWRETERSAFFPIVTPHDVLPFIRMVETGDSHPALQTFLEWVRARLKKP